jgi:preprotein translocase subunit SecY
MNKDLVNKILITLGFLLVYRVLAYVPTPGVDTTVIKEFFDGNSANALGLFNMFSGNAVERLSIISLGIMPYITASIIMELLAATFPELGKLKKERDGMVKYMQIIRYMTIGITLVQAVGVARTSKPNGQRRKICNYVGYGSFHSGFCNLYAYRYDDSYVDR